MDQPTIETLARRLDKVERENFRLKWLTAALVIGGIVIVGAMLTNLDRAGSVLQKNRIIEAEKFVLKDSSGTVRAILGEATLGPPSAPTYGLFFFDQGGNGAELTDQGLYLNSDFAEAGISTRQLYITRYKQSREEIHKKTKEALRIKPAHSESHSAVVQTTRELTETHGSVSITVVESGANVLLAASNPRANDRGKTQSVLTAHPTELLLDLRTNVGKVASI
jgi:hypothetical protein